VFSREPFDTQPRANQARKRDTGAVWSQIPGIVGNAELRFLTPSRATQQPAGVRRDRNATLRRELIVFSVG